MLVNDSVSMNKFNCNEAKRLIDEKFRRRYVAKELGITKGTLNQYLNARGEPGEKTLEKLAKLLGVEVAQLKNVN